VLYPPKPASRWWIWLLAALAVLIVAGVIYKKIKKGNSSRRLPVREKRGDRIV